MSSLTPKQIEWFTHLRLKEADFIIGQKLNYSPALHEFIIDKAMGGLSNCSIAALMKIHPQQINEWMKRFPKLKDELDSIRKEQLEHSHLINAFGEQVTKEITTKKDGDGNILYTVETEKQHPINTISLDRLAQKYAPELAPKSDGQEIDININVRAIDFSKLDKAITTSQVIEGQVVDVKEVEGEGIPPLEELI